MKASRRAGSPIVTVFVLLGGIALLARGLEMYWHHLSRSSEGPPPAPPPVAASPGATPAPLPSATPFPPSEAELAGLASARPEIQGQAVEVLLQRRMTPELAAAARTAVPAAPAIAGKLGCLRARVPGRASLDSAIAELKAHDPVWASDLDVCVCLVAAVASHVEEDPQRVAEALFPFALSYPARPRGPALKALREARLKELSPELRRQIREGWHQTLAVDAAFALGAPDAAPDLVDDWLLDGDERVRHTARSDLARQPGPAAARLLVRAAVANRRDPDLLRWLVQREQVRHDAADQLVTLALREGEPSESRQGALELLAKVGTRAVIPRLAPLLEDADAVVRAYAAAATAELKTR
jgi:hypothetical protein